MGLKMVIDSSWLIFFKANYIQNVCKQSNMTNKLPKFLPYLSEKNTKVFKEHSHIQ